MANLDRPRGLTPIRHLNGSAWNGAMNVYWHSSTDTTAIFKGDVVTTKMIMGGKGKGQNGPYPQVVSGAAEKTPYLGVAWGFGYTPELAANVANLNAPNYAAALAEIFVFVIDDPGVIYEMQDGALMASTSIAGNYNSTGWGSGSTVTGRSAGELLNTDNADGGTAGFRLMRLVPRADNELAINAAWEVMINIHTYKQEVGYTT